MRVKSFGTLIPALTILTVTLITYFEILNFSNLYSKGIFSIGLLLYFPLSFLIDGVVCATIKIPWYKPSLLSLSVGAVLIITITKDFVTTFFFYLPYYLIFFLLGYFMTKGFNNRLKE